MCTQSLHLCSTLCDPVDCSPSGVSVHGFLQARILVPAKCPPTEGTKGQLLRFPFVMGCLSCNDYSLSLPLNNVWYRLCFSQSLYTIGKWHGLCEKVMFLLCKALPLEALPMGKKLDKTCSFGFRLREHFNIQEEINGSRWDAMRWERSWESERSKPEFLICVPECVFADTGVWVWVVVGAKPWGRVMDGDKQVMCEDLGDVRTLRQRQNLLSAFSSCSA